MLPLPGAPATGCSHAPLQPTIRNTITPAVSPARLVAALKASGTAPCLPPRARANLAVGLGGIGVSLEGPVAIHAAIANGGRPVTLRDFPDQRGKALPMSRASPFPRTGRASIWNSTASIPRLSTCAPSAAACR